MIDASPLPAPLSPQRAFIVQLCAETDVATGHLVWRVEHAVSGQATAFDTWEGLLALLARVLAEQAAGPPVEPASVGPSSPRRPP